MRPVGFHPLVKDTTQSGRDFTIAIRLMLQQRDSGHKSAWVVQGIAVTSHHVMWRWVHSKHSRGARRRREVSASWSYDRLEVYVSPAAAAAVLLVERPARRHHQQENIRITVKDAVAIVAGMRRTYIENERRK